MKPVRWPSIQTDISLLDKLVYSKTVNSKCILGSIWPGMAQPCALNFLAWPSFTLLISRPDLAHKATSPAQPHQSAT